MGEIDKGIPQIGMRFRNIDATWDFGLHMEVM
jgi:hypothetical protein